MTIDISTLNAEHGVEDEVVEADEADGEDEAVVAETSEREENETNLRSVWIAALRVAVSVAQQAAVAAVLVAR